MRYPKPYKPKGQPYYYFWYRDRHGKRRMKSTGCERASDAHDEVRRFIDALGQRSAGVTFAEYARPYFLWDSCPRVRRRLEEGKQIGRTYVRRSRALLDKWVIPDAFSSLLLSQITRGNLLDLRARLRLLVAGPNTLNKTIAAVKTVLSEAAFRGDISSDPGAKVGNIKYAQRERGVFTPEEVRELLAARPGPMGQDPRLDAALTLLFSTGCRVGELRALRWEAIDLKTGRARIHQAFQDSTTLGPVKWNKPREIVIPAFALDRLRTLREASKDNQPQDFVLADAAGRSLGIEGLKNAFERTLQAAEGFRRAGRWLTPHSCRHSLNTALLASGLSPLLVQTYLGWSSQESRILSRVQAQYTHLQLLRLEDVAARIEELFGQTKEAKGSILPI
jgi:integrase